MWQLQSKRTHAKDSDAITPEKLKIRANMSAKRALVQRSICTYVVLTSSSPRACIIPIAMAFAAPSRSFRILIDSLIPYANADIIDWSFAALSFLPCLLTSEVAISE